jgi:hypothetical protein
MSYLKTYSTERPSEYIVNQICPQIPNMGVVIYSRSTTIKANLSRFYGLEELNLMAKGIK